MFTHDCSACQRRQLIFPSQVRAIVRVPGGTRLDFTCWCGAEQIHDLVEQVATAA
ncbi:hypothetical protein [Nocardioides terrisoli]|uniref:hypothetical protein n=1 Tax=Nocardioides terrisoli TaxID=3388267 RepID=UPI00287B80D0|nr:hypothetical protein [Nocardioides marmorisolisilvae]